MSLEMNKVIPFLKGIKGHYVHDSQLLIPEGQRNNFGGK